MLIAMLVVATPRNSRPRTTSTIATVSAQCEPSQSASTVENDVKNLVIRPFTVSSVRSAWSNRCPLARACKPRPGRSDRPVVPVALPVGDRVAPRLELPRARHDVVVAERLPEQLAEHVVVLERAERRLERTRELGEVGAGVGVAPDGIRGGRAPPDPVRGGGGGRGPRGGR